jgi:two-component system chemotaxis response regulator CheY
MAAVEPKCILVVDDSAMIRHMVTNALEGAGYRVVTAVDGVDALEKLAAEPETALVVLDVRMPRMSGTELLEASQRDGVFSGPIVMLTTDDGEEPRAHAEALGAKAWLTKPFQRLELLSTVAKLTLKAA